MQTLSLFYQQYQNEGGDIRSVLSPSLPSSICEAASLFVHEEVSCLPRPEKMPWRKQNIDVEFKGQWKQ